MARAPNESLWVATAAGLTLFDGAEFRKESLGLPASWADKVGYIATGPDMQSYAAFYKRGFVVFGRRKPKIFGSAQGLKNLIVNMILPVGEDEAWIGTDGGFLYHYAHDAITEVGTGDLPGDPIYGLARARDKTLWIGTGSGLFLYRAGQMVRYQPRKPLTIQGIFDLAVTSNGTVFAATDAGVLQINGDLWRVWNTRVGLPSDRVQILSDSAEDRLWIGTTAGLAELDGGRLRAVPQVTCPIVALQPMEGEDVWAGCDYKGLSHVRPTVMRLLPGTIPDVPVVSVVQDKAGRGWLATTHGLLRLQNGQATLFTRKDGLPSISLWNASVAPDDSVWVGTENGFARVRKGRIDAFRTLPPGHEDAVLSILQDRTGAVWVGAGQGLLRRSAGMRAFQKVPEIHHTVWSLREDRDGSIWAAVDADGVFRFSANRWTQFNMASGLAAYTAIDTLQTADGSVWIATQNGLSRIRNNICKTLRGVEGVSGRLSGMADDKQGHLWLRTASGIVALDVAETNRHLDGESSTLLPAFFGPAEGIAQEQPLSTAINTIVRNSTGHLWFALTDGVGEIDPSILRSLPTALHPSVYSVLSDAGEHVAGQPVQLQPGDHRLQFDFSAPLLNGATGLEYRYRLLGFEDTWRAAEQKRSAVYTGLPPGKYQFQVSVRRQFGLWSEPSVPVQVRVLPHYYQTWWWYTLLAMLAAAVLAMAYRARLVSVRRYYHDLMAERLDERSRLARELHDTLAQGMVGIHLQLEAAQVLMDRDPHTARAQMDKIGRIAREIASETRKSIMALRSQEVEHLPLREDLDRVAIRFTQGTPIALTVNVEESLPAVAEEVLHEVVRIVEEALTNVRLHSEAIHASLIVRRKQRALQILVTDDGRGFTPSANPSAEGAHFGLMGMRERAQRIHGTLSVASATGQGTQVLLQIPLFATFVDRIALRVAVGGSVKHTRATLRRIFRR